MLNQHMVEISLECMNNMEATRLDEDTDLKSAGLERALGVRVPPLPLKQNARMVELAVTPHLGCGAVRHGGSSPSSGTQCGSSSMVESLPSKQYVASSSLVFRSNMLRWTSG